MKDDSTQKALRTFCLLISLLFASAGGAANCEKHPDHHQCGDDGPSEPPPAGDKCANLSDDKQFPAFAYFVDTVSGRGGNQQYTEDIYVADSAGTCSIRVFSADYEIFESELDFSFTQGTGRIAWEEEHDPNAKRNDPVYPTLEMITFEVENEVITTALPLEKSTVYTVPDPEYGGVVSHVFSPDGGKIYLTNEISDGTGGWDEALLAIDIADCEPHCAFETLLTWEDVGVQELSVDSDGDRIYFSAHDRIPDIYYVAFTENQAGEWSRPGFVVSSLDEGYEGMTFIRTGAGDGPINTDLEGRQLMAFSVRSGPSGGIDAIEIRDVSFCTTEYDTAASSCEYDEVSPTVGTLGRGSSSTLINLVQMTAVDVGDALEPSLLIIRDDFDYKEVDINSLTEQDVLDALGGRVIDAAD